MLLRDVGVRRRSYAWPEAPELPLRRSRGCSALRGVLQHARQRGPGDDRGRDGPRAAAVQRRRRPPAPRHPPRVRRPPARAPLPAHASRWARPLEGYFLDCWPACDRLNRIAQRQVGATPWGPLLDHGVTLVHDAWRHYRGDGRDGPACSTLYPRFVRFAEYLLARAGQGRPAAGRGLGRARGLDRQLLPAAAAQAVRVQPVHRGRPARGRSRRSPRSRATRRARSASRRAADALVAATVRALLEPRARPVREQPALGGRGGRGAARRPLARDRAPLRPVPPGARRARRSPPSPRRPPGWASPTRPTRTGGCRPSPATAGSTPCCASCASAGRCCRRCVYNNTISEEWEVRPDSPDQWSHCAVGPALRALHGHRGHPARRPRLREGRRSGPSSATCPALELVAHTPRGPIAFRAEAAGGGPPGLGHAARRLPGRAGAPASPRARAWRSRTPTARSASSASRSPPAQTTEFDVPAMRRERAGP